jgi:phosphoribosylaminoimidazole carboxylase PurE protein
MSGQEARVSILMGSASDLEAMKGATKILGDFGIPFEMTVASAHRTPDRVEGIVKDARERGIRVFIAGAGGAAHLAGVIASMTTLPVIAVPLASSPLSGFDALLSSVQMPPGIPVATVSVGPWGARNAAILAAQILATSDDALRAKLAEHRKSMAASVEKAAAEVENSPA